MLVAVHMMKFWLRLCSFATGSRREGTWYHHCHSAWYESITSSSCCWPQLFVKLVFVVAFAQVLQLCDI